MGRSLGVPIRGEYYVEISKERIWIVRIYDQTGESDKLIAESKNNLMWFAYGMAFYDFIEWLRVGAGRGRR